MHVEKGTVFNPEGIQYEIVNDMTDTDDKKDMVEVKYFKKCFWQDENR